MRYIALFLVAMMSAAVCQDDEIRTTFYAGLALAAGNRSSDMNPGVNACIEPIKKLNKYLGVGGHLDYSWISDGTAPSNGSHGWHLFDIAVVPKAFLPVSPNADFSFEIDPELHGTQSYISLGNYHDSHFDVDVGLSLGTAFSFQQYSLAFRYKTVFQDFEAAHWITLSAGIRL